MRAVEVWVDLPEVLETTAIRECFEAGVRGALKPGEWPSLKGDVCIWPYAGEDAWGGEDPIVLRGLHVFGVVTPYQMCTLGLQRRALQMYADKGWEVLPPGYMGQLEKHGLERPTRVRVTFGAVPR